jgi:hypothetical protein
MANAITEPDPTLQNALKPPPLIPTGAPTGGVGGEPVIPDPPPPPPVQPPSPPPVTGPVGSGANVLPGQLFDRGEFQESSDAALAGIFGLRPGIDEAQTQREIEQFEQDLTQRGEQGQRALEARLQQLGVLESGITGQRGVDLQTALQQERGRFRTDILGELERRRFGESLQQSQALQGALGQRFGQGAADIQQQQNVFQQNVENQNRNTQMILSLLGLGGVGFPQGQFPQNATSPDRSAAGPAGEFTGQILAAILGGGGGG